VTRRPTPRIAAALLVGAVLISAMPVSAEEAPTRRSFTIAAAGDVMVHSSIARVAEQHAPGWGAYDFTPMFAPIEPWLSGADLAICQMEMTLSATNSDLSYYPRFMVPHELADAVAAAGYDACSTASNHSVDGGRAGLESTIELLEAAGVATTGTARTPEERFPNLYEVNGVTVGHLAYSYSTNGIPMPDPWSVNVIDADAILADAGWAREHGAEFVILSIHWGNEYQVRPTAAQTSLAETLLASPDLDLILGHHVHVVQPIDRIGDKVVVQDDGRFVVAGVQYTPTWVDPLTKEILPVGQSLLDGTGPTAALEQSWRRTLERVNLLGVAGVTPTADPWPEVSCRGIRATILGTPGSDLIVGTDGDDVIAARGGDDSIWAGGGDDLVCGGDGDDFISGGDGDDRLEGDDGNDLLMGYGGADVLWGGGGNDLLSGLEGDDLLVGGSGDDSLLGGGGNDLLWGGDGDDRADGGPGANHCAGITAGCG